LRSFSQSLEQPKKQHFFLAARAIFIVIPLMAENVTDLRGGQDRNRRIGGGRLKDQLLESEKSLSKDMKRLPMILIGTGRD
jgi:hypothetical protein